MWSGDRKLGPNNRLAAVGSTVHLQEASYTSSIGAAELAVVWRDSEFQADEKAFYYARVLQIPTPRWTAFDAKYFNTENMGPMVPMVLQERAYSSTTWYEPQ